VRPLLLIAVAALASPAMGEGPPAPLSGVPASTLDSPGALSPALKAHLDVRMNGRPAGETLVVLEGDDVWVPIDELHGWGAQSFDGRRRRADGKEWVSLRSLSPGIRYALDERSFTLELTVGAALLPTERIDVGNTRPAGALVADATTGFVNYAAQLDLRGRPSGFGEAGVSFGEALISSGFAYTPAGAPVRGMTAFTYEFLSRLEKLVVGDAAILSGGLGSSAVVGGVTWGRDFALDPYLVVAPRPAFTAFVPTASTLEVWVNGAMVRQQPIPAGTLDLTNIPVAAGAGDVRTVLRDAYGREQVFDLRSNFAPALLAPGITDFGYTLGFVRNQLDAASFDYGRPVAMGRHRVGLDEVVTLGGRLEASLDRASLGPSITFGTTLGQLDLEVLGSVAGGVAGAAGAIGWSWMGPRWSAGLRLRAMTPSFATVVLDPWRDRALGDAVAYAAFLPLDRLNLGLDLAASRWRDAPESATATLRATLSLGEGWSVMASVGHTVGGTMAGPSGMLSVTWALGNRTTAQAAAGGSTAGATGSASVARALPVGPGYGYRVAADAGSATLASMGPAAVGAAGLFQYQTGFGRYEADVARTGAGVTGAVRAAGGVVFAGDRVLAARPVEEAYALVRVGVPGVTAYLENQEVGVTDGHGDVLVPALLARYANRLSIRVSDIPMDYDVGKVERIVAPMRKSGVVVRFDVTPIRAVTGRLRLETPGAVQEGVPGGGELVLLQDGEELRAPTSSEGRFFLQGARPGRHVAEVTWRGGTCRVTLEVPEKPGLQDLGVAGCDPGARLAAR
jgi:outer membrane usher protein